MFDPDDILYDEQFNQELEKAQEELRKQSEAFAELRQTQGYKLLKSLLQERFLSRVLNIPNNEQGLYQAFGEMKFRQGIYSVLCLIDS